MKNVLIVIIGILVVTTAHAASIEDLIEADRAFDRMAREQGVREAFLAYAGEDPVMLSDGLHPIDGNEAVNKFLSGWPDGMSLTWEPRKGRISQSGELGYTWGTFVSRGKDAEGNERVSYGKYVTVWALQDDGTWKWVVDIGNPSPAPDCQ